MKVFAVGTIASMLLISSGATAKMTNDWVESVIQGRELAQRILELRPAENFTRTGVLIIDNGQGQRSKIPIKFEVNVSATNWSSVYQARLTNGTETLTVVQQISQPITILYDESDAHRVSPAGIPIKGAGKIVGTIGDHVGFSYLSIHSVPVAGRTNGVYSERDASFAGSDFSTGDLCLQFLNWPRQRILKPYEMRRGRSCKVLESVNPHPSPNGYSRVVSWIDNETLGIVQAKAYDAKGKLLKEFYPKDFKKVNGQWEVGEMEMINDQTGSRSWIKFDLKQRH